METTNSSIDLLIIGEKQDAYFNSFEQAYPDLRLIYKNTNDAFHISREDFMESIKRVFTVFLPKRILLIGEFGKKYGEFGELNVALLDLLIELKRPEQKILAAGFYKHSHANFIQLPLSPKKVIEIFDRVEETK